MARIAPLLAVLAACSAAHDPTETVDRLDCVECHESDYDGQPLHADRGYGRKCYRCHGTSDWGEAEPNHDDFAIGREPHAGYDCAACHPDREDHDRVSCIDCHAHTEGRTWPYHIGNSSYEYGPRTCLRCHGDED